MLIDDDDCLAQFPYLPHDKVIYQSENGRERKVFSALDWLAQLTDAYPQS
ncbi:MAG: hypothetical protein SWH68_01435 [Thermodesulfobacteriota bacterium]|nr:hypothetical protein [Thermodesulfobacteriota bacterium]